MRIITRIAKGVLFASVLASLSGCLFVEADTKTCREGERANRSLRENDQELARLLVKLELRTRGVIAGYYVAADEAHREWMAHSVLLPAAVADRTYHEVVPAATGNRAWVKMVVDKPRNPHNTGDAVAMELLQEIRGGSPDAARVTPGACYYAEPIKAAGTCLLCHGEPKGEPDPFFPQYTKEGWQEGDIIGAVVARVVPAS